MPDISPYTKGIADCLESLGHESPEKLNGNHEVAPRLINMLQGRMLEHLKTRVSSHYGLKPDSLNEEFFIAEVAVAPASTLPRSVAWPLGGLSQVAAPSRRSRS